MSKGWFESMLTWAIFSIFWCGLAPTFVETADSTRTAWLIAWTVMAILSAVFALYCLKKLDQMTGFQAPWYLRWYRRGRYFVRELPWSLIGCSSRDDYRDWRHDRKGTQR